jgi:hypothetical protein
VVAVVDTAAPWCIFKPDLARRLMSTFEELTGNVALSTRLGVFRGGLFRGSITLPADEGQSLDVQVTAFLCPDWPGENFIGYEGLLQRIRFAVDPGSNSFYFGRLE